jgi:hypothetical protein
LPHFVPDFNSHRAPLRPTAAVSGGPYQTNPIILSTHCYKTTYFPSRSRFPGNSRAGQRPIPVPAPSHRSCRLIAPPNQGDECLQIRPQDASPNPLASSQPTQSEPLPFCNNNPRSLVNMRHPSLLSPRPAPGRWPPAPCPQPSAPGPRPRRQAILKDWSPNR